MKTIQYKARFGSVKEKKQLQAEIRKAKKHSDDKYLTVGEVLYKALKYYNERLVVTK